MILGVDMDQVVVNSLVAWRDHFDANKALHGHRESFQYPPPTWSYPPDLCESCHLDGVNSLSLLNKSELMPGAKEGLEQLSRDNELILISHRDSDVSSCCRGLLAHLGVEEFFSDFHWSWRPKVDVCEQFGCEALIDDGPSNIEGIRGSGVVGIIFDWPYNRHLAGYRVFNWEDTVRMVDWMNSAFKSLENQELQGAAR